MLISCIVINVRVCFFQFCDVVTVAIILKRNEPNLVIAQRGQRGNLKNPAMLWQPSRTYCQNMVASENNHSKCGDFGTFSPKSSFVPIALK